MTTATKRVDIHSVGNIIPADYDYITSFASTTMFHGVEIPEFGLAYVYKLQQENVFANIHANLCQCDVCGTWFTYGDVWKHRATGEHITMGWICGEKYSFFANHEEFNKLRGVMVDKVLAAERRKLAWGSMRRAMEKNPNLSKLLAIDNRITRDIRKNFIHWGTITFPQVQLLEKLEREQLSRLANDALRAESDAEYIANRAKAIEGRHELVGDVLGIRVYDNEYNGHASTTVKMLVMLDHPDEGLFKAWGTVPRSILKSYTGDYSRLRGHRVKFKATFEVSVKDEYFSYFTRPSNGTILDMEQENV